MDIYIYASPEKSLMNADPKLNFVKLLIKLITNATMSTINIKIETNNYVYYYCFSIADIQHC
jgi:hypothetical protein